MKLRIMLSLLLLSSNIHARQAQPVTKQNIAKQSLLRKNPYQELPLGAIKPSGWLKEMLIRQKTGSTGNLDKLYPEVMGPRNGWLGGDGDQWERGPYWLDGLLPLAYLLNDKDLIAKTKPWIEWAIKSQQPDGYFGPSKDYEPERGIQRDNSHDWWPKMVMLKVLKQHYSATGDKRILKLMTNYFHYQLRELPGKPLDNWTFWAKYRGGDNLMLVYWLYNITRDESLLQLAELIHKQTFDYTNAFLDRKMLTNIGSIHCVNLAQGFKEPVIYFQQHPEERYLEAVKTGFKDLKKYNGMAHGLYGGDETLHGNNPTQGSELCSAVEMMFSLESMLEITGQVEFADHLEKIAFNALPTQASDDYMTHQYFQQANQVMATHKMRNFETNHDGTDVCFGLLTGFPCCTSNMHQGWPKFTQNLWYSTEDGGLAALVYSANEVTTKVNGTTDVTIKEETNYPFDENIRFSFKFPKTKQKADFPFHLRIPAWCKNATIKLNGQEWQKAEGGKIVEIKRLWSSGDIVDLTLPMHTFFNKWAENSRSVERGPLVYVLKIGEQHNLVKNPGHPENYGGESFYEVRPTTPWNYGLIESDKQDLDKHFQFQAGNQTNVYPWNLQNAPVSIKTKGRRIPSWQIYNDMAGPLPFSPTYRIEADPGEEEITLIPYGCSTLRIAQFPVLQK